jgi:16S rRNA (uracil1498-N3)-methyltransferase
MTRRRWIADEVSGNRAALTGAHADHLVRVLRARTGQEFDVVVSGIVRRGKVAAIGAQRVEFEMGEEVLEPKLAPITLVLAIFKFDRMEWAIEKCTELGVSKILPVVARRTEAHLGSAAIKRTERWRRIAHQAAEQSRRSTSAEISAPLKLTDLLKGDALKQEASLRIVLAETEEQTLLRDVVKPQNARDQVLLAIGPEGGWTEDELQSFHRGGWISASLGNTILRAETAAIAATAIVLSSISRL